MQKNKNKKTFLVTGGAGFIGSHLCEKLIKIGHKVVCFDNLSTGTLKNILTIKKNPNFVFIKGDINQIKDISLIFRKYKFNGVFHYAATVGVKRTLENPLMVLKDAEGIKNILELSLKYGRPKVVFASSSEVYGESRELPEKEEGAINPQIPYAAVKLIGEKFLEAYYYKHNLKTCSLRFFNVYGPRQDGSDYGFVVGIFIRQVLSGQSPTVFGDGRQTRDFTFIDDNVEASWRAMKLEKTSGQIINIGSGRPLTIFDLATEIINLVGLEGKIKPRLVKNRKIDIDVRHRFPEVGKMIKLLNFYPKVSLEEGLKKMIDWYKNG
ncbi:GDP-mannose 4,6-dehydratase [Patescibacteria group bacterium]|nr:GDP-mannose 4,6-dehydratase [Patescibacteria group bacterium]